MNKRYPIIVAILAVVVFGAALVFHKPAPEYDPEHPPITWDEGVDDEAIKAAVEQWNMLPENIKKAFVENGWQIILTDDDLTKKYQSESVKAYNRVIDAEAVTVYQKRKIYILADQFAVSESLVHEVGHFIDYMVDTKSKTDIFIAILQSDINQFYRSNISQEYLIYPEEYFAEVFAQAMQNPELCSSTVPQSYQFIMDCIGDL